MGKVLIKPSRGASRSFSLYINRRRKKKEKKRARERKYWRERKEKKEFWAEFLKFVWPKRKIKKDKKKKGGDKPWS